MLAADACMPAVACRQHAALTWLPITSKVLVLYKAQTVLSCAHSTPDPSQHLQSVMQRQDPGPEQSPGGSVAGQSVDGEGDVAQNSGDDLG